MCILTHGVILELLQVLIDNPVEPGAQLCKNSLHILAIQTLLDQLDLTVQVLGHFGTRLKHNKEICYCITL